MNFDTVHNYYEKLVFNEIVENYRDVGLDEDQLADLACLSLNQLTPRYIRYAVDMSFFLTLSEQQDMHNLVTTAVKSAYNKITQHQRT